MIKMMLICMVKTIGRVFHILDINFGCMHVIATVLNLQEIYIVILCITVIITTIPIIFVIK